MTYILQSAAKAVRTSLSLAEHALLERKPEEASKYFQDADKVIRSRRFTARQIGWTKAEIANLGRKIKACKQA